MLVEHYQPDFLFSEELDNYLSKGWFRSGPALHRSEVFCFEEFLHTVINIRLPLNGYTPKKRFRRIYKKVKNQFRVTVGHFYNSLEKETLYKSHKHRFNGFVVPTLFQYLNGEDAKDNDFAIFDTYEVCIFDGDKLIGFSIFDIGNQSISSILGVFDSDYAQHSLGTFTMLEEIEFAISQGFTYYYPGYILHNTTIFDYKLRLGAMEFYNHDQEWKPIDALPSFQLVSEFFKEKINEAQRILTLFQISSTQIFYSPFAFAYFDFEIIHFIRSPIFLLLFDPIVVDNVFILEYWIEEEKYVISEVEIVTKFNRYDDMQFSEGASNSTANCLDLLRYSYFFGEEDRVHVLISNFIDYLRSMEQP